MFSRQVVQFFCLLKMSLRQLINVLIFRASICICRLYAFFLYEAFYYDPGVTLTHSHSYD